MDERLQNRRRIFAFLILAFVIAYAGEILYIIPLSGSADLEQAMQAQSLLGSIAYIPAVCAILTRALTKEPMVGSNLMLSLNLKKNLKYYGLAWFGTVLLIGLGALLYFTVFPRHFDANMGYFRLTIEAQMGSETFAITSDKLNEAMRVQILTGIFLSPFLYILDCFGEEWGWRGYLLPKMLKSYKVVPTVLISGFLWGLWYAPLVYMGQNYGIGYFGYPIVGILAMCLFCMTIGVLLSYITIKTGSCIPAILCRGVIYGFGTIGLFFTSVENPYNIFLGPSPYGLIGCLGFLILAVWLLYQLHQEEKKKIAEGSRMLLQ